MQVTYSVKIEGRVTGVGFRYSALNHASRFESLYGYIRNVGYGQVESVVQGPEEQVEMMLEWLKHGPSFARVERIMINPIPPDPTLEKFTIT